MWKLTSKADGMDPIPGVPWQDMDDAEFEEVAKSYAERNQFPADSLHTSGFFEHVREKAPVAPKED